MVSIKYYFLITKILSLRSPKSQNFWKQKLAGCVTTKLARWVVSHHTTDKPEIGFLDVPISPDRFSGSPAPG
ncbi:hypothetical protein [Fischerella thermalis]|uniref:hypothetical protein n=1 Tax=Fischerella thermalis TaxID=372787 RepID=UPI0015E0F262|nr:hypothetical protein [Fischerella thermalis]